MFPPSTWAYHIEMKSILISVDKANILLVSVLRVFQLALLLLSSCLCPSPSLRPRTILQTQNYPTVPELKHAGAEFTVAFFPLLLHPRYPTDPGLKRAGAEFIFVFFPLLLHPWYLAQSYENFFEEPLLFIFLFHCLPPQWFISFGYYCV